MAKVSIEFDTSTKQLTVNMDGKTLDNVNYISISKGYYDDDDESDKFSCSITTVDETNKEEQGYRMMTQIVAKDSTEATQAKSEGAVIHPTFSDFLLLKKNSKVASIKSLVAPHRRRR